MTMHAIIYDRASTKEQENNYSRGNAKREGIRIAEQHGYTWEYVQEIGSGTTLSGRPKMLAILDRIAAGEVQRVIVQDLDRLARPVERAVYETIRNIFIDYGVIVHTHSGTYDFTDDDSDFMADISMAVAKKETRRIKKRMTRGRKEKAEMGRYIGGRAALGYKICYIENGGRRPTSDIEINPEQVPTVKAAFELVEKLNGNISGAARQLNQQGFRGKDGKEFSAYPLLKIITNKIYVGIVENILSDKPIFRPELQIITVKQFKEVQRQINRRKRKRKNKGGRGNYLFTGFVVCGNCGGPMVGHKETKTGYVSYMCHTQNKFGKVACSRSKSYGDKNLTKTIIKFLTKFIEEKITFMQALNDAANEYGKTVSEEALESATMGELMAVQGEKQRLVDAIAKGILTTEEAAEKLQSLREEETNLTIEIAGIKEKATIREDYLSTIKKMENTDVKSELTSIAEEQPIVFRRMLALIFKPNSLHVHSERMGKNWRVVLDDYEFTDAVEEYRKDALDITLPHPIAYNSKFW